MTKTLKVVSDFEPAGSQPEAINNLVSGLEDGLLHQTCHLYTSPSPRDRG